MLARFAVCALVAVAACDVTTQTNSDFGVVLPGCHAPNKCYAVHCGCNFGDVDNPVSQGGCMVCDPAADPNGTCNCNADGGVDSLCRNPAEVCVGHAPNACHGRCVRAGKTCAQDLVGEPPQSVSGPLDVDGMPTTELRCAFADDICCAGDGG
jgi:hypothetical protein